MPVVRTQHTENYTVIPNSILQDQRLSLRDRGLLLWMLSMPPDWKFTRASIVEHMELDGDRSVRSGVKKLQELGYLVITKGQRQRGKLPESIWTVYDVPQSQRASKVSPRVQNEPVATEKKQSDNFSPQVHYPPVQNAPDYKVNKYKGKNAVPALEGGIQLPEGYYLDPDHPELGYRRKENL